MKWILFVYLLSFDARGGMTVTSAEFNTEAACHSAASTITRQFKTLMTQEPKTLCVEKGEVDMGKVVESLEGQQYDDLIPWQNKLLVPEHDSPQESVGGPGGMVVDRKSGICAGTNPPRCY